MGFLSSLFGGFKGLGNAIFNTVDKLRSVPVLGGIINAVGNATGITPVYETARDIFKVGTGLVDNLAGGNFAQAASQASDLRTKATAIRGQAQDVANNARAGYQMGRQIAGDVGGVVRQGGADIERAVRMR